MLPWDLPNAAHASNVTVSFSCDPEVPGFLPASMKPQKASLLAFKQSKILDISQFLAQNRVFPEAS